MAASDYERGFIAGIKAAIDIVETHVSLCGLSHADEVVLRALRREQEMAEKLAQGEVFADGNR